MAYLLLRIIVNAVAIVVTAAILPGITVLNDDIGTFLLLGLVFGLVNAVIKPLVTLLTCPLVILTLGLFIFVINGLMLLITAALLPDRLAVDGLGWAILGGIVMALVGLALDSLLGLNRAD